MEMMIMRNLAEKRDQPVHKTPNRTAFSGIPDLQQVEFLIRKRRGSAVRLLKNQQRAKKANPQQVYKTPNRTAKQNPKLKPVPKMEKQKQQVISRFFAPKSKPSSSTSSPSSPSSSAPSQSHKNLPTPPPKITSTVTFSTSKRLLTSQLISPSKSSKIPRLSLSPHTHNPINPSLHQKFLKKLLEPCSSSSPSLPEPSRNKNPNFTPLEQQVVELKSKYPDVLLMVEVGYRYRFFGDDAENAARVLGIYAHVDHNFLTASVPTFRLNVHVRRLVSAGYKVGVVKQTETAAIKAHGSNKLGPFCRGLSALYTKATLEAAEDVGGAEEGCGSVNNYLVCVVEKEILVVNKDCSLNSGFDVRIGFVAVEVSTGDVVYGEFDDNFMRSGLEAVVLSLSPAEILLGEPLSKQTEKFLLAYSGPSSNVRVERASRYCFKDGGALPEVMSLYENTNRYDSRDHLDGNTLGTETGLHNLAVQALALTIRHLKQFGFERLLCLGASFRPFSGKAEMMLSANALQQLEVLMNNTDGSETGSLLQSMNNTLTIYGLRLLRHWVAHPLCDRNLIKARLDAVSEIVNSMGSTRISQNLSGLDEKYGGDAPCQPEVSYVLSSVLTNLGRSVDIQRGLARIFHRTATATEFIAVMQTILSAGKQLQQLRVDGDTNEEERAVHSILLRQLISTVSSSTVIGNAAKLLSTINKDAAEQGDLLYLIIMSDGKFQEVGRARTAVHEAKEKLDSLIGLYCKQLRMHKLEFMSVSGITHLIELPSEVRVPLNWVKVNSTKKTIRYHPPEVLSALDRLALATEELNVVCRAAWDNFLRGFVGYYNEFQAAVQALAALDCLHSFAIISRNMNYVRPVFVNDDEPVQIHICSGRHPVLENVLEDNFVPNDTELHADGEYCQIITGPNMGGKSCYIRQVALIVIMAQVGCFVPASAAKLHVLDGIHTRMGASDSIQRGRSTFLEELSEASHVLSTCTAQSLVIIDELGRGTSTHDGVAIAHATLHHLLGQKKCLVLFVTHYLKIVDIRRDFPESVGAYHVSYLTSEKKIDPTDSDSNVNTGDSDSEDVTYLYKLVPGVSDRSFGFKVAQLAQLPSSCIQRGVEMAAKLEAEVSSRSRDRFAQNLPLQSLQFCKIEQEGHESISTGPHQSCMGKIDTLEYLAASYSEVFSKLKSALGDDNQSTSFMSLMDAKILATELVNRFQGSALNGRGSIFAQPYNAIYH
ncbi:DNA mismatch repair protein MutS-like, N-terminal [Dillenia turbinata]|uniref:DNA mismatch repair protein MSH3 n=1 Tax=Dillenia turbinata TaxID=194707 RepID=A0AAN8ZDC8_9MAGN